MSIIVKSAESGCEMWVEKKEANTFSQGGTYDQYRRWSSLYPDCC